MKLITYASPSHMPMCERFVVANASAAGFESCTVVDDEQLCPSGRFNSEGFAPQVWRKLEVLATLPTGQRYCFLDADCLPLPGLARWCNTFLDGQQRNTIGLGDDNGMFCTGTVVWQQTEETAEWWRFVRMFSFMLGVDDQCGLNTILDNAKNFPLVCRVLCKQVFSNWAATDSFNEKPWAGEEIQLPQNCLCWHANFCLGVDNKIKQLEHVEKLLTVSTGTV